MERQTRIDAVEVTNVSQHGLWLLIQDTEVFLPFEKFPWFRDAPIGKVLHVELPSAQHLYWPELDVDLEVESVLHPERYPLVSRVHEAGEGYAPVEHMAEWDEDKIDECVLALLQLTLHDGARAWKGFDFEVMSRLFEKSYITAGDLDSPCRREARGGSMQKTEWGICMEDIRHKYLEIEAEAIRQIVGGTRTDPFSQFKRLLSDVLTNIRSRSLSEGLNEKEYEDRIYSAITLLNNLKSWMNPADEMSDAQKKLYDQNTFWAHRKDITYSDESWPILRYELRGDAKAYFETPYMQDDNIDCLLIDALIYAEVAPFKTDVKEQLKRAGGHWHEPVLWAAVAGSFFVDRLLFIALLAAVVAYKILFKRKEHPALDLYNRMLGIYLQCKSGINAKVLWDMLEKARDQGAIFDAVLYDLLERQIHRNREKIEAAA